MSLCKTSPRSQEKCSNSSQLPKDINQCFSACYKAIACSPAIELIIHCSITGWINKHCLWTTVTCTILVDYFDAFCWYISVAHGQCSWQFTFCWGLFIRCPILEIKVNIQLQFLRNCHYRITCMTFLMNDMQSSAVIMRSNIVRYYINHYRNWGGISMRCWIHKRHDIPHPNELVFCEYKWENWLHYNITALYKRW